MVPEKKSSRWWIICILYFIVIFAALLVSRLLITNDYIMGSIPGILVISLCSALPPSIAGYFEKKIFFILFSISILLGLIYAFYVALGDIAPGWGTLTSIIGYLFFVGIGLIVALIAETLSLLLKYNSKNK
ncbi:MAG: hypothetical protein QM644_21065 [Mobilitalea sp.]